MKKILLTLSLLTMLKGNLGSATKTESALVKRVIDGDTIVLDNNQRVRLICIDTPEKNEFYYQEAKNRLTDLIDEKYIVLEIDVSNKDRYGRLLRYVYHGKEFVNLELVKEGYAKSYRFPPDVKYCDMIEEAEKEAREKKIGIWK